MNVDRVNAGPMENGADSNPSRGVVGVLSKTGLGLAAMMAAINASSMGVSVHVASMAAAAVASKSAVGVAGPALAGAAVGAPAWAIGAAAIGAAGIGFLAWKTLSGIDDAFKQNRGERLDMGSGVLANSDGQSILRKLESRRKDRKLDSIGTRSLVSKGVR